MPINWDKDREGDVDFAVLKALVGYGVIKATADFSGSGDDGQINDITTEGIADPKKVDLKPEHIELLSGLDQYGKEQTVEALLYAFCYEVANRSGHDWINNEGGWGTVTIVPGNGTITLNMNVNITTSEHHPYEFSIEEDEPATAEVTPEVPNA